MDVLKKRFKCDICSKDFLRPSQVLRHMKSMHPVYASKLKQNTPIVNMKIGERKHVCDTCGKSFLYPAHVLRHKKTVHQLETQDCVTDQTDTRALKKFPCITCGKSFLHQRGRQQHMRKIHKVMRNWDVESKKNLKCSECLSSFPSSVSFLEHISENHPDIKMQIDKMTFKTFDEFESWKLNMEKMTCSSYILRKSYKNGQEKRCNYYNCHRSGIFKSSGKGIRRTKISGSNKIGFYCPARIKIEIVSVPEKIVRVVHYCTHVGHQCDIGYLRLKRVVKDEIFINNEFESEIKEENAMAAETMKNSRNLEKVKEETQAAIVKDEIFINNQFESEIKEENTMVAETMKSSRNLQKLKEEAQAAVLGFLPYLETLTEDEQYKAVITSISSLKHACEAIATSRK